MDVPIPISARTLARFWIYSHIDPIGINQDIVKAPEETRKEFLFTAIREGVKIAS